VLWRFSWRSLAFLNLTILRGNTRVRAGELAVPGACAASEQSVDGHQWQTSKTSIGDEFFGSAWPALFAVLIWLFGWFSENDCSNQLAGFCGWGVAAWAVCECEWAQVFCGSLCGILSCMCDSGATGASGKLRASRVSPAEAAGQARRARSHGLVDWRIGLPALWDITAAEKNGPRSARRATTVVQHEAEPVIAQRVIQEIRVDEKVALATAKIHWEAEKGASLPLLFEPAVLTRVSYPSNALRLVQGTISSKRAHNSSQKRAARLISRCQSKCGSHEAGAGNGLLPFAPVRPVNRLDLTVLITMWMCSRAQSLSTRYCW